MSERVRRFACEGADVVELAKLLVGRRIVAVTPQHNPSGDWDNWHDLGITLDDGSVLRLEAQGHEADGVVAEVIPAPSPAQPIKEGE